MVTGFEGPRDIQQNDTHHDNTQQNYIHHNDTAQGKMTPHTTAKNVTFCETTMFF
jgi:hypothetical protein